MFKNENILLFILYENKFAIILSTDFEKDKLYLNNYDIFLFRYDTCLMVLN